MPNRTEIEWELGIVGIIIVLTIIVLASVVRGYRNGAFGLAEAGFYASIIGAMATIALATTIFYQNYQNNKLIQQNNQQSMILQESEWIPEAIPFFNQNEFRFKGRRPWYPRLKIDTLEGSTGWVEHDIIPRFGFDDPYDWDLILSAEFQETLNHIWEVESGGSFHLSYETQTGIRYHDIYRLETGLDENGNKKLKWPDVERILPWEEGDKQS